MPLKTSTCKIFYIALLLLFTQCSDKGKETEKPIKIPSYQYDKNNFQVIGHRGYADIYPENTLLSIEEAFKRGVQYCEIDVNVTSDDIYVLFHDQPTIYRTSNGSSYISTSTYDELLKLDYGSWKGSQFNNTKIATLEEALLLAEKYDGYLYLDTKKFRPDLMGNILKNTNINPKRLMPAIANLKEATDFKKHCPDSPFIYFGGMPQDPNDDNWYKQYVDLGCEIFETYYTFALDNKDDFKTFANKVHQHNAKVWVFTSNSIDEINLIKKHHVDGVESDIATTALKAIYTDTTLIEHPSTKTTGNWTFEFNNLYSTGVGSQLRPLNYPEANYQDVTYGTPTTFGIKPLSTGNTPVVKIPAFNPKNGLFIFTNFTPLKDENLHYNYSLIMDLYLPNTSEDSFISLFQTSPTNSNDADFFISPKGLGINNEYHGTLETETWYRIGIIVTKTSIKKYINGNLVGEQNISGGRWSVYNFFSGGQDQGFLLFADDDNETSTFYLNALQLRNYAMQPKELELLGLPKSEGIPISNTGIYAVKFEGELKKSIVNWDTNEIYVFLPKLHNSSKTKVWFSLPYGATSSVKSGDEIDLNLNKERKIKITAQDKYTVSTWKVVPIFQE